MNHHFNQLTSKIAYASHPADNHFGGWLARTFLLAMPILLIANTSSAQTIVIDNFEGDNYSLECDGDKQQCEVCEDNQCMQAGSDRVFNEKAEPPDNATIIGGFRDMYLEHKSGDSDSEASITSAGTARLSFDSEVMGDMSFVWDGMDNSSDVQTEGLCTEDGEPGVDLTNNGTVNTIAIRVRQANADIRSKLGIYFDMNDSQIDLLPTPSITSTTGPAIFRIRFSQFEGTARFDRVGAIELAVQDTESQDITIDYIRAEPDLFATLEADRESYRPGDDITFKSVISPSESYIPEGMEDNYNIRGALIEIPISDCTSPVENSIQVMTGTIDFDSLDCNTSNGSTISGEFRDCMSDSIEESLCVVVDIGDLPQGDCVQVDFQATVKDTVDDCSDDNELVLQGRVSTTEQGELPGAPYPLTDMPTDDPTVNPGERTPVIEPDPTIVHLEYCGDGQVQAAHEACDPNGDSTCNDSCKIIACSPVGSDSCNPCSRDEQCEDNSTCYTTENPSSGVCLFSGCGNGVLEGGESCDDGNDDDADSCNSFCQVSQCNNGVVDGDEECDGGEHCLDNCTIERAVGGTVACTASPNGVDIGTGLMAFALLLLFWARRRRALRPRTR